MSYWNHRVFHDASLDSREKYFIGEAIYDDDDRVAPVTVTGWTMKVGAHGATLDEVKQYVAWMVGALDKPLVYVNGDDYVSESDAPAKDVM